MEKLSLNEMLNDLQLELEQKLDVVPTESFFKQPTYIIFLSATSGNERSIVIQEKAHNFTKCWKKVSQTLKKKLFIGKIKPQWIKADLVTSIVTIVFGVQYKIRGIFYCVHHFTYIYSVNLDENIV